MGRPAKTSRYRSKGDPSVVYSARPSALGRAWILRGRGLGNRALRVPRAFFEEHYEPDTDLDTEKEGDDAREA